MVQQAVRQALLIDGKDLLIGAYHHESQLGTLGSTWAEGADMEV